MYGFSDDTPKIRTEVVQKGQSKPALSGHWVKAGAHYYDAVQRLFSMFPTGLPGAALFLLRVSVIGMLFDSTIQNFIARSLSPWWIVAVALISLLLICGAFTPIASVLSIILEAVSWPAWNGLRLFEFFLQALVMVALFLLGPGAYSIDLKMFGRRLILPPE